LQGKEPEHEQPIPLELPTQWRAALLARKENVAQVKTDEIAVPGAQRGTIELFQKPAPARQPVVFLPRQRHEIRVLSAQIGAAVVERVVSIDP
jgi:hypothetical protein